MALSAAQQADRALLLFEVTSAYHSNPKVLGEIARLDPEGTGPQPRWTRMRTAQMPQVHAWVNRLGRFGVDPAMLHTMLTHSLPENVVAMAVDSGISGAELNTMIAEHGSVDVDTLRMLAGFRASGMM